MTCELGDGANCTPDWSSPGTSLDRSNCLTNSELNVEHSPISYRREIEPVKSGEESPLDRGVVASIVIPVYNGEQYLPRLLGSLRGQTFEDFEMVIVDDHSTDESLKLISRTALDEPRLRLFQTPHNLGTAPRAVNFVLPEVSGTHFLYSSQDDFFSPDWLESMLKRSQETGADAVVPEMVYYHGSRADRSLKGLDGDREAILGNRAAVEASLSWRIPGCALWRTEAVRRVGWSDVTFDADELSVRKLFHSTNTVAFSGGTYFYNQLNENAITKVRHSRQLQSMYTALELRDFLQANGYGPEIYGPYIYRAVTRFFRLAVDFRRFEVPIDAETTALVDAALSRLSSPDVRQDLRTSAKGRGRLATVATSHGSRLFGLTTRAAAIVGGSADRGTSP